MLFSNNLDILDTSNINMVYFCHILKTSGTSLEPSRMSLDVYIKQGVFLPKEILFRQNVRTRDNTREISYFNLGHCFHVRNSYNLPPILGGHVNLPFEYFEDYTDSYIIYPNLKFSIIRNPFDLLCSYYHHIDDNGIKEGWGGVNNILKINSFEDFIHKYCDSNTVWPQPLLKENLFSQLYNEKGNCMVDLIIKYENRDEALQKLMDKLNADIFSLNKKERVNNNKKNYKEYYTPELIKLVENKCKFELETFRYNFNGSIDDNYYLMNL